MKLEQQITTEGELVITQVRMGLKEGDKDMDVFIAQNFVKEDFEIAAAHVVNPVVELFKKYLKSAEVLVAIASTHAVFFTGKTRKGMLFLALSPLAARKRRIELATGATTEMAAAAAVPAE